MMNSLDELTLRKKKAMQMGGEEKIAQQHAQGKMTARERIDKLLDKGSFYEMGQLATSDLPEAKHKTPADGKVCGFGLIDGKQVGISTDDPTVLAGSGGRIGYEKEFKTHRYAQEQGFPSVHLGDGGGARIPDIMGATGMMTFTYNLSQEPLYRKTPLITCIMGECYGGPTWKASLSDIVIQVKGSIMAVSGPPVLAAATGEIVTAEDLGGYSMHAKTTGLVDLWANNELEALKLTRKVLNYLPANSASLVPQWANNQTNKLRDSKLLSIIPEDERYAYHMHDLLKLMVDRESILELKAGFDDSLITTLARIDGRVVGILANNPKVTAGAMGPGACDKAVAMITLCDSYNIPLVLIHDTPGFFVSKRAEEQKMPIKIMNFIKALHLATVPKISLIIRKSYGMAHCNMLGANMGADFLLAWPTAQVGFMAPEVAMNVVLGRKLSNSPDPEAMKAAFLNEMARLDAPWEAAERNFINRIIDPRDTKKELATCLQLACTPNKSISQHRLANWPRL